MVKAFMDECVHKGYELGYAETMFHRKRDLYELRSPNRNVRSFGERAAMPDNVTINAGIRTYAIQKPCHIPTAMPAIRHSTMDRYTFQCHTIIICPAKALMSATTEPTARSMLPPVRIHSSIPTARITTYAFWNTTLDTFMAERGSLRR